MDVWPSTTIEPSALVCPAQKIPQELLTGRFRVRVLFAEPKLFSTTYSLQWVDGIAKKTFGLSQPSRKAEWEKMTSVGHDRSAMEQLKQQLKGTTGGYTGCLFMILTCGISAFIGYQLGGQPMIMPFLIVGVLVSFPVYFAVNRFAPSRAERDLQNQLEQKRREVELFEQRSSKSKESLAEAQQQLASFRSWREARLQHDTARLLAAPIR